MYIKQNVTECTYVVMGQLKLYERKCGRIYRCHNESTKVIQKRM